MTRLLCLSLALATLAACDSAEPTETPPTIPPPPETPGGTPGPVPSITFTPPASEISGAEDGAEVVLALRSLFTLTGNVGPLTYSASPAAAPVAARIDGDTLRIALVSAGAALVRVTASGPTVSASGTFTVRSVGRCPAAAAAGQVVLLPDLADRDEWAFTFEGQESPTGSGAYRTRGTAVLRFGTPTCADGVRTQPVTENRSTESSNRNPATGVYGPYGIPQSETRTYAWTTTADRTTSSAPAAPGRNPRASPPFGPSIPRAVETSAFDSGVYVNDQDVFGPRVTFTAQDGLVTFNAQTNYGNAGQGTITWTRLVP